MPAFKVWCDKRERKKSVVADNFESFISKVKVKFSITEVDSIVLEEDGTDIDDDDGLEAYQDKVLMVLNNNAVWTPRCSSSSFDSTPSSSSSPNQLSPPLSPTPVQDQVAPSCHWSKTFTIPWQKLRTQLLTKLQKSVGREAEPGMKPNKTEISEVIRIVVAELRTINKYPGREALRNIAESMIKSYKVLADLDEDGSFIGSGLGTIAIKLEDHNNYLNRPSNNATLLALVSSSPAGPDGRRKRKAENRSAQCGTKDWQPEHPEHETETTQAEKKKWLLAEAKKSETSREKEKLTEFMEATYSSQRLFLNGDRTVAELKAEWPLLLEKEFLFRHCEKLILNFNSTCDYWAPDKLRKIVLNVEQLIIVEKAKAILEKNEELKRNKMALAEEAQTLLDSAKKCQTIGAVMLIMHKFNERRKGAKQLFVHKEEGSTRDEILEAPRSPSPCIVVVGRNLFEGDNHYVVAENTIISSHAQVSDALTVTYCLIFLFNMKFNNQLGHTWEFLQRYIFRNNPDNGSKNPKRKASFANITSPVNTFIRDLVRFEVQEPAEEDDWLN